MTVSVGCAFVDQIGPGETVRLDLNDGTNILLGDAYDLTPPGLRRVLVETMMQDGTPIPASAYGNRTIRLPLAVVGPTPDAAALTLQALHRELDRPTNILRWQPDTSDPVYFRTYRCPDYAYTAPVEFPLHLPILNIPAEPFALGEVVELDEQEVFNDPTVANGRYMDLTGIIGDVETPAIVEIIGGDYTDYDGSDPLLIHIGTRRRRDEDNTLCPIFNTGCENFVSDIADTNGTDASAVWEGGFARETTFATTTTIAQRCHLYPMLGAAVPEHNGRYRMFVRAATDVGTVAQIRFRIGRQVGQLVTVAATPSDPAMHDMGVFTLPSGDAPQMYGYLGSEAMAPDSAQLDLQALRVSGGGSLFWDYVMLVPADEEQCEVLFGVVDVTLTDPRPTLDAVTDHAYIITGVGSPPVTVPNIAPTNPANQRAGSLPFLTPGVTNRWVLVNRGANSPWEPLDGSLLLRVLFWPRYLGVKG